MTRLVEIATARSFLFVPASRPDRFERARASGADLVIIDLEDAVPVDDKATALANVRRWVDEGAARTVVRINGSGTTSHAHEVRALAGSGVAVMVPKAEAVADLAGIVDDLRGAPVIALVETARGVLAADAIAGVPGVARLALGNVDLASSLGVDPSSRPAMWRARTELVLASAAHGLPGPVDGVTTVLDDRERLEDDLRHGVDLGFTAKLCIHPRQVEVVNAGWRPTPAEVSWAHRVLSAEGGGAVVVDGEMVDPPVVARARTILSRVDAPSPG